MATRSETKILVPAKKNALRDLAGYPSLRDEIVGLLQSARQTAARTVNALMTATYWDVGRRIVEAEQKGKRRADYGEQLIERLAIDLTAVFGRGFRMVNLTQMRRFYSHWPQQAILQTVSEESPLGVLASKAQTPLFSIHNIMIAHVHRGDLFILNYQLQCDAIGKVDGDRMQTLQPAAQCMQAQ